MSEFSWQKWHALIQADQRKIEDALAALIERTAVVEQWAQGHAAWVSRQLGDGSELLIELPIPDRLRVVAR